MAVLAYKARDGAGRLARGRINSAGEESLREELRSRGLYLIEASPARKASGVSGGRVRAADLILFTFHLQAVTTAGIPLLVGLRDLAEQTPNRRFRRVVEELGQSIQEGSTLSQALGRFPAIFPESYVHMVEAGESSGQLDEVLARLTGLLEWSQEMRAQLRQLLTYPAIVISALAGLVVLLLSFVLPRFQDVLVSLDAGLPWPTRALMRLSDAASTGWPVVLGCALVLAGSWTAGRRIRWSRERMDAIALRVPGTGPLLRALAAAQIAHFLGALSAAGVPVTRSLELLSRVMGNLHLSRRLDEVGGRILSGFTLTQSFAKAGILPPMVQRMISIGEETGDLPGALRKAEEFYDRELPRRIRRIFDLAGPILTVVIGAVLLFVLLSVLLPLYQAYSAAGGAIG